MVRKHQPGWASVCLKACWAPFPLMPKQACHASGVLRDSPLKGHSLWDFALCLTQSGVLYFILFFMQASAIPQSPSPWRVAATSDDQRPQWQMLLQATLMNNHCLIGEERVTFCSCTNQPKPRHAVHMCRKANTEAKAVTKAPLLQSKPFKYCRNLGGSASSKGPMQLKFVCEWLAVESFSLKERRR